MGGLSNFWRNKLLSHGFGKEIYVASTNFYVALSSTNPLGTGLGITEPSGGSYARVSTVPANWAEISGFETSNLTVIQFAQATSSWGTMTYFAVFDSLTGGNMLFYGSLVQPMIVTADDIIKFGVGDLVATH